MSEMIWLFPMHWARGTYCSVTLCHTYRIEYTYFYDFFLLLSAVLSFVNLVNLVRPPSELTIFGNHQFPLRLLIFIFCVFSVSFLFINNKFVICNKVKASHVYHEGSSIHCFTRDRVDFYRSNCTRPRRGYANTPVPVSAQTPRERDSREQTVFAAGVTVVAVFLNM